MRDYFKSVFENNKEVRVLVVATDGSAWLPASQRDATAAAKAGLEISLLHCDGREVAVTAAGIAGVSPDAQGKNLEAIFFSPAAGTTGDALAEKLSIMEEVCQGLSNRLAGTESEIAEFRRRLADFGAENLSHHHRIEALETAAKDPVGGMFKHNASPGIQWPLPISESPAVEPPVVESPAAESPVVESPAAEPPVVEPPAAQSSKAAKTQPK